jgi:hypothetical protein
MQGFWRQTGTVAAATSLPATIARAHVPSPPLGSMAVPSVSAQEIVMPTIRPVSRLLAALLSLAVGVAGCATSSKEIASASVSPLQYQSFDCDQLAAESMRINGRAAQLAGRLDEAASNDKVLTGVGIVLFWPALFFLGGTKQQEAEYARLKGESEAVQQMAIQRRCTLARATEVAPANAGPSPAGGSTAPTRP